MSKDPVEYIRHILDESEYILSVTDINLLEDDFLADETLKERY